MESVLSVLVHTMITLESSDLHGETRKAAVIAAARALLMTQTQDPSIVAIFDAVSDTAVELVIHASRNLNVAASPVAASCLPCRVLSSEACAERQ